MSRYFPLFVDLEQKKIVVVGAGRIAERRIQTLLSFEAQITVIAPEASVKIRKLAKEGRLHWQQERWSPEAENFLDGSLFVLAAVDDGAVNKAVFRARHSGQLFRRSDTLRFLFSGHRGGRRRHRRRYGGRDGSPAGQGSHRTHSEVSGRNMKKMIYF